QSTKDQVSLASNFQLPSHKSPHLSPQLCILRPQSRQRWYAFPTRLPSSLVERQNIMKKRRKILSTLVKRQPWSLSLQFMRKRSTNTPIAHIPLILTIFLVPIRTTPNSQPCERSSERRHRHLARPQQHIPTEFGVNIVGTSFLFPLPLISQAS